MYLPSFCCQGIAKTHLHYGFPSKTNRRCHIFTCFPVNKTRFLLILKQTNLLLWLKFLLEYLYKAFNQYEEKKIKTHLRFSLVSNPSEIIFNPRPAQVLLALAKFILTCSSN